MTITHTIKAVAHRAAHRFLVAAALIIMLGMTAARGGHAEHDDQGGRNKEPVLSLIHI